jgi:phosphoglycolate phosphatase
VTTRGVVFDLDGTLVDSLTDIHESLSDVLVAHGHRALTREEARVMLGDGARKLVERALVATGGSEDAGVVDVVVREFLDRYEPRAARTTVPYDGIPDVLRTLCKEGLVLAVCTNKPRAATLEILQATGLLAHFVAVVAGDDVERRKPDPAHVLAACAALGLPPAEVAMVGDGPHDLLAAAAAGTRAIGVRWGYGQVDSAPAEFVAETPLDLLGGL